ncbi:GGDEF domain-containing protein [Rubrobacter xylanophilus]|nr:GGDEF domain-containing protein [Rubrobacter xylanophilus]
MDDARGLGLYGLLSRLGRPKSYEGKIMLVAFTGTHIPLLAITLHAARSALSRAERVRITAVALAATLAGTAGTLYALHDLLEPLRKTSRGLRGYLDERRVPRLPAHHTDEAGRLMAETALVIGRLDRALRSLEQLSRRDHLTGLHNRRSGEMLLEESVWRARRDRSPFSLALLDLKDFKKTNDAYGHATGDEALVHLADVISRNLRRGDWVARWGGDEFLVGLPGTAVEEAAQIVDRLCRKVRERPLTVPQAGRITLEIRAGVAGLRDREGPGDLLRRADAALIARKARRTSSA